METNRAAFGVRICLTVAAAHGQRHIYRTVGYVSSFGGNPLRQHIGIGAAQKVEKLEVTWPASRMVQTFTNIAADQSVSLREGDKSLVRIENNSKAWRNAVSLFVSDVRYSLRQFSLHRGFAITVMLTLALEIGANVPSSAIVDAVLLRPLPYRSADRLVVVGKPMLPTAEPALGLTLTVNLKSETQPQL